MQAMLQPKQQKEDLAKEGKNIIIMISHTRDMFFKEGKNIITSFHTRKHIPGESTPFYGKFLQVDKITS
jgi:hypothetical protein